MIHILADTFDRLVLRRPVITIVVVAAITATLGWFAKDFSLDASADSLTLENDEDLNFYRFVRARYGSDDFLLATYTPNGDLFSDATLGSIGRLRDALAALPEVAAVTTILDVPLVASPPVDLRRLADGIRYLGDPATDRELARRELTSSPLYEDLMLSTDGRTTAIRIDLRRNDEYFELRRRRDALRESQYEQALSDEEEAELARVTREFEVLAAGEVSRQREAIASVRQVLDEYRDGATIFLGGLPMIVSDSIDFIRSDLVVFGTAVLIFLIVILAAAFKKRRWIILPLLTCAATCICMIGLLGLLGWQVTVVSSNFLSLLLILCLALNLHIIVRYREIHEANPDAGQIFLIGRTVRKVIRPCLYTALTTIVAFGSLIVSGVRPVIDFGWMMSLGIVVAFMLSFTLFPAILVLLDPGQARSRNDLTDRITRFFGRLNQDHRAASLVIFMLLVALGIGGATRLSVENRFIDYYKETTEIYQGMLRIDRALGGTTPLDIIVDAPAGSAAALPADRSVDDSGGVQGNDDDLDEDDFEDIYADDAGAGITATSAWINGRQIPTVLAMQDYLDGLHDTGKVISIATFLTILEDLEPGILEDSFSLSIVFARLPEDVRSTLVSPYLSEDGDQLRFGVRVFESDPALKRDELLRQVRKGLTSTIGIDESRIRLSGMLVLYNNMLNSLFRSQILTLGAVFLAIMTMFLVLFRSLKTALVAITPNVAAACIVLGVMGWTGIPLDLMTITIAAITVGIGVDDTIHYTHRFRDEFAVDRDYWASMFRCHRSIGRAIYYTSITIMLGFSILVFSRFVPTIYFGLLTSLAMLIALVANLTILPLLIISFQTEGPPADD